MRDGMLAVTFFGTVTLLLAGSAKQIIKKNNADAQQAASFKNGLTLLGYIQAKDDKDRRLTSYMRCGLLAVTFSGTVIL